MSSFSVDGQVPVKRPGRGWLLPASLAVNLLLGGLILAWLVAMPPPHQPMLAWQRNLLPELSSADAAIVAAASTRIAEAQEQGSKSMHAKLARVSTLLATEPLDNEALGQTLDEMSTTRCDQQAAADKAFFAELVALSPEGRTKILSAMQREARRWRPPPGH
jgi:hypothetical protein